MALQRSAQLARGAIFIPLQLRGIEQWKGWIEQLLEKSKQCWIIFNNNSGGDASDNAKQLLQLMGMDTGPEPLRQMDWLEVDTFQNNDFNWNPIQRNGWFMDKSSKIDANSSVSEIIIIYKGYFRY